MDSWHQLTSTDEILFLGDKIKANQAQYDLDKESAKIFVLSSEELDQYEYLTGEDLVYISRIIEQAKFEYFPLGKSFNKGLKKQDKKKVLLESLKNSKDKTEEQLKSD